MVINQRNILLVLILLTTGLAKAQNSTLVAGKPLPKFILHDVRYYENRSFSNDDLAGKWTILDFWTKYCVSCVQSFPKVNELQKEFKNNIRFVLVGRTDNGMYKNTEAIYERYRKAKDLDLIVAYDSAIFDQFGVTGVPYIIIVDPQSNVHAITNSGFLTTENLDKLLAGNKTNFDKPLDAPTWEYFLNENDKTSSLLYRSILSANIGEPGMGDFSIEDYAVSRGTCQVSRADLNSLYRIAYFGITGWLSSMPEYEVCWPRPLLQIADSALFQTNYLTHKGYYNYSLIVPVEKSSKAYLMTMMQQDLKKYFGYEAAIEKRKMPCWKLTATDEAKAKLASKSEHSEYYSDPSMIAGKRIKIKTLLAHIHRYNSGSSQPEIFVDETGIENRIDIEIKAAFTDLKEVANELRKIGLILEKTKKEMNVLVIRDRQLVSN